MTGQRPAPQPVVFEVTVIGGLGATLEAALSPVLSHGQQVTTLVRTGPSQQGLVETLGLLDGLGLEVAHITQVD